MDYLAERKLNLRDMNLKHVRDEIYLFKGIEVDMSGCGCTHMQMYRHIAEQLAKKDFSIQMKKLLRCEGTRQSWLATIALNFYDVAVNYKKIQKKSSLNNNELIHIANQAAENFLQQLTL